MEQSIIHIKAPHVVHIGAKAKAAMSGTSMNGYIVKLIQDDLKASGHSLDTVQLGIDLARSELVATPKTIISKNRKGQIVSRIGEQPDGTIGIQRDLRGICKFHAVPLDSRGKCLQKGCKYAK